MSIEKHKIVGSINEQVDKEILKNIEDIYKKINIGSEFEFMMFNYKKDKNRMGLEHFLKILEYMNLRSKKSNLALENIVQLDLNYTKQSGEVYRITIDSIESINKYIKMLHMRKNHVIFSVLAGLAEKDKSITLMKKVKERENIVDVDDFDIRARLSEETDLTKKEIDELKQLDEKIRDNITYRYKQRISLFFEKNKDIKMSLDLTNTKMSRNINRLEDVVPIYEIELDLSSKIKSPDKKYLNTMFSESTIILKVIQQSNFIISKSLEDKVLGNYANLLGIDKTKMISLEGRKPQSLEVQHVVDQLPNKYAVTDKADGERYFLMIYKNVVFLISDLLNVKNTGLILPESKNKYNDTILDGELIFIKSKNRYLYMIFDCLFNSGKDVRQLSSFLERLQNADDVVENCFVLKGHNSYKYTNYDGKFDIGEILKFHNNNISKFMNSLVKDIDLEKQYPLIRRKYFIAAQGGQNNEIFKYSELVWNKYVYDKSTNCPYILDGLIYHPLDQKYVTSVKESKYVEYKWKPPEKNSIDFYVMFEKNRENNKIVTLYDNSRDEEEQIRGKPYKVIKLHVGKTVKGIEQPILFEPENDSVKYAAYMFLIDGEVRDLEGNIIQDNTVVEFYYNNDPNIPDKHRWVPIRTRYDKTESVQRFGKKYGNYVDIAYKVWRSIRNPFLMNDISILSKDDLYNKHIEILRNKIDHSVILSERKENIYYQIRTTLGKPMRNFHNWIKSILIYTYVNSMYEINNKQLSVLDIGCGRGGDLMKFYYGKADFYVGIDIDNNGLISPVDGALSRYNQLRKTHPNFPRMFFIHADGGVPLNYEDQLKGLGGMSEKNKELMIKFFSKEDSQRTKFDRLNCQFVIHYFFANQTIWDNFVQNVNNYLKPGGYFMITTFDADRIISLLENKNQFSAFYTNTAGEQKVLFEVVKKYTDITKGDNVGVGVAIDFHNALDFQEGVYVTEYLVQKKFLEEEFLNKCNMTLVETDLFENQYIINKDFFLKASQTEDVEKTRKFFKDVLEYYTQKSEVNSASQQLTRLYRYYVFRKKDDDKYIEKEKQIQKPRHEKQEEKPRREKQEEKPIKEKETKKSSKKEKINKKMKGGIPLNQLTINDYIFNDATDLFNPTKFIKRDIQGLKDFSFLTSVHDILKNSKLIPENTSMMEFYDDISFNLISDKDINEEKIRDLNKNLVIKHDYSVTDLSSEIALDGLNLLVVNKDCDGSCTIDKYGKNGKINKNSPTSIIYYDGEKYYPIYKIKDKQMIGTFNSNMRFIKNLLKEE